jgi:integrase
MPRRTGAVVEHTSGRGVVFRLRYADATGRRACETLGLASEGWTPRRAEQALRERLVDVKRDRLVSARPLTFAAFAEDALTGYLDTKGRRKSTRDGYLAVLDQHLDPYFGRMQLDTIEPADVDGYVAKKRRAGLSAATVNRHLNVMRRVCKLAVRAGKMRVNPVLSVDPLEEPDRRLRWRRLQPEEVGAVAKAFDELVAAEEDRDERDWIEQARVVFLVVYGLGLRRGEVLGLRWRSIRLADPENKPTLSVDVATVLGRDGDPKSQTSRRTLVLDEFLAGELFDHLGRTRYQGDSERVFCHPLKGSALDHKRYAGTFRKALTKAEITDYIRPFHDGRHSAITNDAAAGNSGLAVMKRAGHSDFRVTQMYLDLAGVDFAEEAERAGARAFAHVPRAKVQANVEAE